MTSLTKEQRELLSAYGIHGKMQDISILDYPKIAAWFKGDNGQLFLTGEKGIVLHGGWEATKIGYSILRWLVLVESKGAIIDLWEFANEPDDRLQERYLLIQNFQNEEHRCPLDKDNISQVENLIMSRYTHDNPTILDCYYTDLSWYSAKFKEFINDCYLVLDVQRS